MPRWGVALRIYASMECLGNGCGVSGVNDWPDLQQEERFRDGSGERWSLSKVESKLGLEA
jgi:hypothetical protein